MAIKFHKHNKYSPTLLFIMKGETQNTSNSVLYLTKKWKQNLIIQADSEDSLFARIMIHVKLTITSQDSVASQGFQKNISVPTISIFYLRASPYF